VDQTRSSAMPTVSATYPRSCVPVETLIAQQKTEESRPSGRFFRSGGRRRRPVSLEWISGLRTDTPPQRRGAGQYDRAKRRHRARRLNRSATSTRTQSPNALASKRRRKSAAHSAFTPPFAPRQSTRLRLANPPVCASPIHPVSRRYPPKAASQQLGLAAQDHQLFDLGDGLGRVQVLGAGSGAVHDRVAAVEPERVFERVEPRAGRLVAAVGDPAIGLQ
jgi:hypothetical protein